MKTGAIVPNLTNFDSFHESHGYALACLIAAFVGFVTHIYYFVRIQQYRTNKMYRAFFKKYFEVRQPALFITDIASHVFFSFIAPVIWVVIPILIPKPGSIYFLWGAMLGTMMVAMLFVYSLRMWILFAQFSYAAAQVEEMWQSQLSDNYSSWFLKHPGFTQWSYVARFFAIPFTISAAIFFTTAFYFKVSVNWQYVYWVFVISVVIFNLGLVLLLHRRPAIDNFGCRDELTWYFIIILLWTGPTLPMELAFIWNAWYRGAYSIAVISGIVTSLDTFLARAAINAADSSPQMLGSRVNILSGTEQLSEDKGLSLMDVVQNDAGMSLFAAYLVREYAHESILFIMEVFQFRKQFKHVAAVRDNSGPEFQISDNVPKCRTLKENPDDFYKQAEVIRDRFIPYSSNLCINISHQMRKDLEAIDFRKLDQEQLAVVFDDAYRKIFSLLRDPFFRFRETYEYEALVRENKTSISHQTGSNLSIPVSSQNLLVVSTDQTENHMHKVSQDININLFGHKDYTDDDKIHHFLKNVGDSLENCCSCKKSSS